jgi:hypothetical protein
MDRKQEGSIMNHRVVIWIISGCTILCLGIGILVFFLGSMFVRWATQTPEDIEVNITAPAVVALDEKYTLVVEITNLASEEQTLDSIDIDLSYLDGVVVGNTEPAYAEFADYGDDYHSFEFQYSIPAEQTLEVSFFLTGIRVGDLSGELNVCINSFINCTSRLIRTIVEE